jgi:26S proteasome regulatory subunit N1
MSFNCCSDAQDLVKETLVSCEKDSLTRLQLAHMLARHGFALNLDEVEGPWAADNSQDDLQSIISNSQLSKYYLWLARDLDVMEPKLPEEVREPAPR